MTTEHYEIDLNVTVRVTLASGEPLTPGLAKRAAKFAEGSIRKAVKRFVATQEGNMRLELYALFVENVFNADGTDPRDL